MFKRESLVTLKDVDKAMYKKLYEAVIEVHADIKALDNQSASAEDRAIAAVSILDDLDRFASVFSDASKSYKKHTGEYLSEASIPGLKYRKIRLKLSQQLFMIMRDIYPEKKSVDGQ